MKKIIHSWEPCAYEVEDIGAIQALMRGEAQPHQQTRALQWIIEQSADTYGPSFYSDPLEMAHHEGRRHVGNSIIKLIKLNIDLFKKSKRGT